MSTPIAIPFAAPHLEAHELRQELLDAVTRVIDSAAYINGPSVTAFEAGMARFVGVGHAVGVGNGTDALTIALLAAGVGAGDEVITASHSAVATAMAIARAGATPVLVDIDEKSRCMDPAAARRAVGPKTRAIVPVHIYGHPADITALLALARERGLTVVEDCAQAQGALFNGAAVGSMGAAGAFSFYPTKNLGAIGDGGCLVTNDQPMADKARALREYGWARQRFVSDFVGLNSRLDELQAAILIVKLAHLARNNARRAAIARRYAEGIRHGRVQLPSVAAGCTHAWHLYVVESDQRDPLRQHLATRGVGTGLHYPVPIHQQPAFARGQSLPVTERLYRRLLTLPLFPQMTDDQVQQVIEAVNDWAP